MKKLAPRVRKFIQEHSKLLDENKFTELYGELNSIGAEELTGQFTQVLFEANIPFLQHIESIVRNMFNGTIVNITTLPSNIKSIGTYGFREAYGLRSFTVPETVVNIASGAFRDCTNLTSIDIKAPTTCLYTSCFRDCVKLSNVTLPNTIERLNTHVFANCTALKKITLPKSIEYISDSCFVGSGLETIIYEGSEDDFNKIDGSQYITTLPLTLIFQE